MAESKYSLKLAAVDAYSSTFGDFNKKAGKVKEVIQAQQAELKKLNSQAKDVEGFTRLGAALEKTSKDLAGARTEQARLSREQAAAANRAAELATAYGKAVVATKALEAASEASAVDIAAARAEQKRLAKELDAVTAASKRLDQQQDKATGSVKSLERAETRQRTELTRLGESLTKAGVDTNKLASEQTRLKASAQATTAALEAQRAKLEAVKRASGKIEENRAGRADLRGQMLETAAIGYLASRPIDKAMKLETAMADVGKVLTFSSDSKLQAAGIQSMASDNLKLASDRKIASAGMTAVDLAKIEYAAGQSGIGKDAKTPEERRKQIMDFTRDAAIMGAAFDIDAQTAGETMAGWQASMKLDRTKTLDLADATNYLGNNFNAKAADIAAVVKRFGAVGSASGMTPEQSAALSAALLNPGTEKEIAGTGFKNFLSALTAGKSATKGEKTQWKELGFDPEDLAADMQKNAPATIMSVLKAIKAQPKEEQAAIATNLFGSESIGAIQPLIENLDPLTQAFGMVGDKSKYATSALGDQASMMQEAEGVAKTSRTSWNAFTARIDRMTTLVGNSMLPALNAVLVPLGAIVDGISWAAESFPNITGALAVAAGGLAALKVGALGLKFAGLLMGQAFNKAGLARAKLDGTTARTATTADLAVARLNAAMGRLGGAGGAGDIGGGAGGKGKGKGIGGRLAGAARLGGRLAVPLAVAAAGIETINGLQAGDAEAVGSGLGGAAGGMGGAWAGGATGAAIGTLVLPGVGTAVGAAVGSLVGGLGGSSIGSWLGKKGGQLYNWIASDDKSESSAAEPTKAAAAKAAAPVLGRADAMLTTLAPASVVGATTPMLSPMLPGATVPAIAAVSASGEAKAPGVMSSIDTALGASGSWLGEKLTQLVNSITDRLGSPDEVSKQVAQAADNRQITFSPQIQINGADHASQQALAKAVMDQLRAQFMPMMTMDPLSLKRSASLSDGSTG
ncbi:phage tail tape measure protein [Pseudomonas luteola]|uniref:phage tail tape measure protein n=1 Tax=Pseudomonas luteola TaxID=47886 RepID=UPI0015E3F97F|nr:phage tail tape measure protein [Pseudomonas zeshuii]MBA1250908.1 phage tail tape measure protein [Pseudomonas zeshuii]